MFLFVFSIAVSTYHVGIAKNPVIDSGQSMETFHKYPIPVTENVKEYVPVTEMFVIFVVAYTTIV